MANDEEISTTVVVILLVPVVLAISLMGYVIYDSLSVSQAPTGPSASVVFADHPDHLNQSDEGEGIVTATIRGEDAIQVSALVIEVVNPRANTVIVSLASPTWNTSGAGQTIELQTNGSIPMAGETLAPGDSFVLRETADDLDGSDDLVDECNSYVFRAVHTPSETVLGTFETTFVSEDWAPGEPCDPADDD